MARKAPPPPDTSRKLASSKIWNGAIYSPGMENHLPDDFPMDGPHWDDYEEEETEAPKGLAALNLAAQHAQGAADDGSESEDSDDAPAVRSTGRRAPRRKR